MNIDRIDFVEFDHCHFCSHKLTTQIAYIVILDNGKETQAGPKCIRKYFKDTKNVPNFTNAVKDYNSKNQNTSIIKGIKKEKEKHGDIEIEYLLLRCKLLDDFIGIKYQPFVEIFTKTQGKMLDDNSRNYIGNLIHKLNANKSRLSYKNLMACYMAKRILDIWIKRENNDFAKSLYKYLIKNYYLTKKQINGANKWIKNMRKIPEINDKWFYKE
jgi:hypothetical protein